jgi:hypothetical protein
MNHSRVFEDSLHRVLHVGQFGRGGNFEFLDRRVGWSWFGNRRRLYDGSLAARAGDEYTEDGYTNENN